MFDLVINGRILQNGDLVESYICIENETIADIRRTFPDNGADKILKMGNSLILPGAIDLHTHMRDPGLEKKEDLFSGTLSAAFGGVTSIVDMPNTRPPTIDPTTFSRKKETANEKAYVDFGLNIALMEESDLGSISGIKNDPALAGLKIFLGETTGSLIFKNIQSLTEARDDLLELGLPVSVHAEDGRYLGKTVKAHSKVLIPHLKARPWEAEASAIKQAAAAMGDHSGILHLLHISSSEGMIEAAGTNATIEVTPHHLLLDVKNCERMLEEESLAKVNPPLRTSKDRAVLWEHINKGRVDTLGSDHAPHELELKLSEDPPSGIPGVETMVPLMLVKVKERKLSLDRLIELTSFNPARRLGLQSRGGISEGSIADLNIVDMKEEKKIRGENLHSKCGWTPYEGMNGIFPSMVIARGELIIENEVACSKMGRGEPIRSVPVYK